MVTSSTRHDWNLNESNFLIRNSLLQLIWLDQRSFSSGWTPSSWWTPVSYESGRPLNLRWLLFWLLCPFSNSFWFFGFLFFGGFLSTVHPLLHVNASTFGRDFSLFAHCCSARTCWAFSTTSLVTAGDGGMAGKSLALPGRHWCFHSFYGDSVAFCFHLAYDKSFSLLMDRTLSRALSLLLYINSLITKLRPLS